MKMMKRVLAMLLVLAMLMPNLTTIASATTGETETTPVETEAAVEAQTLAEETTEAPAEETTAPIVTEPEMEPAQTEAIVVTEAATEPDQTEAPTVPEETQPVVVETVTVEQTVSDPVMSEEAVQETVLNTVSVEQTVTSESGYTNDEMFQMFLDRQFYGSSVAALGTAGYDALKDAKHQALYTYLKGKFASVAANGGATAYTLSTAELAEMGFASTLSAETMGITGRTDVSETELKTLVATHLDLDLTSVIDALLADCPYEMYWYDKKTGCHYGYSIGTSSYETGEIVTAVVDNLEMSFTAADNYIGNGDYDVNPTAAAAAAAAAAKANTVVETYKDNSDYEKLVAYKQWIMDAVSYNTTAAESNSFVTDNDPWQLIYVFDEDDTTNVVCEGYSKAFQYLCDLSAFTDETFACYTAMGSMNGGAHMWNIVTLGGSNYLVDVTNSDENTSGSDGSLFLAGAAPDDASAGYTSGYTFTGVDDAAIQYVYSITADGETTWPSVDAYGEDAAAILTLSEISYEIPTSEPEEEIPEETEAGAETPSEETTGEVTAEEQALADALAAAAENAEPYELTESITIQSAFEIPAGATLQIGTDVTLTVAEGAALTNAGQVDNYGTLVNNGTVTNNGTVNNSGTITGNGTWGGNAAVEIMTAAKLQAKLDALKETGGSIYLTEELTVTDMLTIPTNVHLTVAETGSLIVAGGGKLIVNYGASIHPQMGGSIVVRAGGTLTLDPMMWDEEQNRRWNGGSLGVEYGGTVTVEQYGTLNNNGKISAAGQLTVNGTYNHGESAQVDEQNLEIVGISKSYIDRVFYAQSAGALQTGLDTMRNCSSEYNSKCVYLDAEITGFDQTTGQLTYNNTITIDGNLFIPSDTILQVGRLADQTATLVVNGTLHVEENARISVLSCGGLTVNELSNWGDVSIIGDGTTTGIYTNNGAAYGNQINFVNFNQAYFEAELDSRIKGGEGYTLEQALTLEDNLTINTGYYQSFMINSGGSLTVPENVTLTIEQSQIVLVGTGAMTVNGILHMTEGMNAEGQNTGGYIVVDEQASLFVAENEANQIPDGAVIKNITTGAQITGLEDAKLNTMFFETTEAGVNAALAQAETYHGLEVYLSKTATLSGIEAEDGSKTLTIPENAVLIIRTDDEPTVVTIPSGTDAVNNGYLVIQNTNSLVVEAGATLTNNRIINNLGALYLAGGHEDLIEGTCTVEGETVNYYGNEPLVEEKITPYLTVRLLDDWGDGLFENTSNGYGTELIMSKGEECFAIFCLNTWNSEKKAWERTPVIPTTTDNTLTILDIGDVQVQSGQTNSAYFVRVRANEWCPEGTIVSAHVSEGVEAQMTTYVDRLDAGFYTAQPDFANMTEDQLREIYMHHLEIDPMDSSTWTFYFGVDGGWTLQDGKTAIVSNGADKVSFEKVEGVENVYKITVNEDIARNMWSGAYFGFLQVVFDAQLTNDGGETEYQTLYGNLGVSVRDMGYADASFTVDGQYYSVYENNGVQSYIIWTDNGPKLTSLPAGVAYDLATNTMTLTDADLGRLQFTYHWEGWDQDGNTIEGYDLPNKDVKLVLNGTNSIYTTDGMALALFGGVELIISGEGSLNILADNGQDGYQDEEGKRHSFDAVCVGDGSSLVINSGMVDVTIAGNGYWTADDGSINHSSLAAIRGYGGSLTLNGGSLTTNVPEGARESIYNQITDTYLGGHSGLASFRAITINGGTLNTSAVELYRDDENGWRGTYTQTGGTVTITDVGSQYYSTYYDWDSETNQQVATDRWSYNYCGLQSQGDVTISGGSLTINVMPTDEERAAGSYFNGINMIGAALNISGTADVKIVNGVEVETEEEMANRGANNGTAVHLGDSYDYNGNCIGSSSFTMSGGTLYVDTPGGFWNTIMDVSPNSTANVTGGYLYARNNAFYLGGNVTVGGEAKWDLVYSSIYADGSFTLAGGTLNLKSESQFRAQGDVKIQGGTMNVDDRSVFHSFSNPEMTGGTLNFDNGFLLVHNAMNVNGGTINIDHTADMAGYAYGAIESSGAEPFALLIKAYMSINNDAVININVASDEYPGIKNWGTFHQMGGTVTVNQDKTTGTAMYANGTTTLQGDAVLNLYGDVAYHFEKVNGTYSNNLFVYENAVLNAHGQSVGLKLQGSARFGGEASVNAYAAGVPSNTNSTWPQAVELLDNEVDDTVLTIDGGSHTFEATNTTAAGTESDGMVKGLSLYENTSATVNSGKITIDAEMPVYSRVENGLELTNKWDGSDPILDNVNGDLLSMQAYSTDFSGVYVLKNDEGTSYESVTIHGSSSCGTGAGWQIQPHYGAYYPETGLPDLSTEDGRTLVIGGSQYLYEYDMSDADSANWTVPEWYVHKNFITHISVHHVRNLSSYIFGNLDKVEHIYIDKSVTEIDATAFAGCISLKTIDYDGTEAQWKEIFKGTLEGVTVNCGGSSLDSHYPEFGISWLDNEGWGWIERQTESYNGSSIRVGDKHYVIFYRNIVSTATVGEGDEAQEVQILEDRIPIALEQLTVSDPDKIKLTRIQDMEDEDVADAQNNGEYFLCMEALDGWDSTVNVSYTDENNVTYSMNVDIRRGADGFYTSATPTNDSWVSHIWLNPLMDAEDGVVYFAFEDEDRFVDEGTLTIINGSEYVKSGPTKVEDTEGVYKIEVSEDTIARSMRDHLNFELSVQYDVLRNNPDYPDNSDEQYIVDEQGKTTGMWFHNGSETGRDAYIEVNGIGYEYYQELGGYVIWHEGYDDHYTGVKTVESDTVSLTLDHANQTATLTLAGATLESMRLCHEWADRDENGEIRRDDEGNLICGIDLPYENLNIVLVGTNVIESSTRTALELTGGLKVNISGEGSLLVKTNNTYENWNDAFRLSDSTELTIGGNADVKVEVAGTANDFLSPFRGCETGRLTITDNAVLTTDLLDGSYDYDHRGLERFASITVEKNATLNTQGIYLNSADEMGTETASQFIQTGGTVVIDAHMTQYNGRYNAQGLLGSVGSLTKITGGTLTINAKPEDDTLCSRENFSFVAMNTAGGTIEIGGTANVIINGQYLGDSLYVSGWGDQSGTFRMTGGTYTTNPGENTEMGALNIDWGSEATISGGILNLNGAGANICSPVTISGGELNLNCMLNIDNGVAVNMTDGTVNYNLAHYTNEVGAVNSTGAMDIHPGSTFTLSGGAINVKNGVFAIGGEFNLNGGTVTVTEGDFYADNTLNVNGGKLVMAQEAQLYQVNREDRPHQSSLNVNGSLNLNDGSIELTNVYVNVNGTLNLNGGSMKLDAETWSRMERAGNAQDDDWIVAMRVHEWAQMNVAAGSLNLNVSNFETDLEVYGDYNQTGGYVSVTENGIGYHNLVLAKGGNISGGSLALNGAETGILLHYSNDDERTHQDGSKLTISGSATVDIDADQTGISMARPMVISGGDVDIDITSVQYDYDAGVNSAGVSYPAQSVQCGYGIAATGQEGDVYLTITGGSVDINVPTAFDPDLTVADDHEAQYADLIGIFGNRNPININGGVIHITAADSIYTVNNSYTDILNTYGMNVISNLDGKVLTEVSGIYEYTGGTNYFRTFEEDNVFGPSGEEVAAGAEYVFDAADSITIASNQCGSSTYWNFDGETLTIYGSGDMIDYTSAMSAPWFAMRKNIQAIVVKDGVKSIGDFAFTNAAAKTVRIPADLVSIGMLAFQSCENLTEIDIPASVEEIGDSAFLSTTATLKVFHESAADTYAQSNNLSARVDYHHVQDDLVLHEGSKNLYDCKYGCAYSQVGTINEETPVEDILSGLEALTEEDTAALKTIVEESLADPDAETSGAVELIDMLDQNLQQDGGLTVTVENADGDTTAEKVNEVLEAPDTAAAPTITRAAVNADETTYKVSLVIEAAKVEAGGSLTTGSGIDSAVMFSMTLQKTVQGTETATELEVLKIPVTITLPVPASYQTEAASGQIRVLHYKDGTTTDPEVIAPAVTQDANGVYYVTFVLDSFSNFGLGKTTAVKVNIADQTVELNGTPDLSYTLTAADGSELDAAVEAAAREALGIELGYDSTANAGEGKIFIAKVNKKCGYSIAEVAGGKLTVNKMAVTVSAIDATIKQGEEIPELGYTVAPGAAYVQATVTTDADPNVSGEYTITVTVKEEDYPNYDITVENGTLIVEGNPSVIDRGKSLILKGEIYIKQYVAFENIGDYSQKDIIENAGMLVWEENKAPASIDEAIYGTQSYRVGLTSEGEYQGYDEYSAKTKGIPACEYGDVLYLRPYINIDGEYHYGDMVEYSVLAYCESRFVKSSDNDLKSMLVAMLNFGSAAQTYFNYKADSLVNSNLANYNLNEEWLAMNWSDDYLTPVNAPSEAMTVNFAKTDSVTDNGKSLYLKGLISVKYYMGVGEDGSMFENAEDSYYYFWTQEDYLALESSNTPLSKENASYKVKAELSYTSGYGYEYYAQSEGVPASEYGDTMYACFCVTDSTGTEHCSGMITYSPEQFASNKLNDGKATTIDPLLEWMVVYGERAKIYLT